MKGNPNKSNLRGRFRIESLVLYQGEGPEDNEMKREVGKSDPGRGKRPKFTILSFEGLRAIDRTRSVVTISGKGRLTPDGRGESKGLITTSDGYHWEMKCSRV